MQDEQHTEELLNALSRYADLIRPWARATATRMLADVSQRNEKAWAKYTQQMSKELQREIRDAPTGEVMRTLLEDQVELITSLPIDAGRRVQELALQSRYTGTRFNTIVPEILRTGEVTRNRATLIARTETARASTALTQARATHIGSDSYIWRTAKDTDVRKRHKALEGKVFRWDAPPVSGERGERSHPGAIYNCRCYPEPIIPDR